MKELYFFKNFESDIVFVKELMGNFIGGGGGIVKKDCFFDIFGLNEEIYVLVIIKFLELL